MERTISAREECLPASRRNEVMIVILRPERREGGCIRDRTEGQLHGPTTKQSKAKQREPKKAKVKERGTYSTPQEGLRGPYSLWAMSSEAR